MATRPTNATAHQPPTLPPLPGGTPPTTQGRVTLEGHEAQALLSHIRRQEADIAKHKAQLAKMRAKAQSTGPRTVTGPRNRPTTTPCR